MSEKNELERVLQDLDELAESLDHGCHITTPCYDAARLLRALAADFGCLEKRSAAQDKLLASYRVGRQPSEETFRVLEKYDRAWLDAARERWRLTK